MVSRRNGRRQQESWTPKENYKKEVRENKLRNTKTKEKNQKNTEVFMKHKVLKLIGIALVLLVAFGSGFVWASAVLRM